jgi:transcriptional repressor NrdR
MTLMVVKKDGRREPFDRGKVLSGIIKACEKRPVPMAEIERIVNEIERGLNNMMEKEVNSSFVGELIMEKLKDVDEVAYVRFASVYRQFTDVNTFVAEVEKLLSKKE